jgi:hypothetical protein
VLAGEPPALTYQPRPDFSGVDSFTFKASDGVSESAAATVYLVVSPVDDPPVARDQRVLTEVDTLIAITLEAVDPEGAPLQFEIVDPPSAGILSGSGGQRLYHPGAGFGGFDSFTFRARDEATESNLARVTVVVGHLPGYTVIDLGTLGGPASRAEAINRAGQVAGSAEAETGGPPRPFLLTPLDTNGDGIPDRWYEGALPESRNRLMLGLLPPSDGSSGTASGLNDLGAVAGTLVPARLDGPVSGIDRLGSEVAFFWNQGSSSRSSGAPRTTSIHMDGWPRPSRREIPSGKRWSTTRGAAAGS